MSISGHVLVDLDGTLAYYNPGKFDFHKIGPPIPPMVERVKAWLAAGVEVRIFTARVSVPFSKERDEIVDLVQAWCRTHIGQTLPVTCIKDWTAIEIWDDRAVSVEMNTGRPLAVSTRGLA
jgi:hypothetical protein